MKKAKKLCVNMHARWLLYKIGFLFCGNYPFCMRTATVVVAVAIQSHRFAIHFQIKTYARTQKLQAEKEGTIQWRLHYWLVVENSFHRATRKPQYAKRPKCIDFEHHFYGKNFHDKK